MERWRGKVAVVTGASAGIGAAIAEKLVEEGLRVVGLARRKHRIEELAATLEGKPGKLYAYKVDMTKQEEIQEAFKWIKENVGPVHILINNAGINRKTTIIDGNIEDWKKVLDTNILGLAVASREAIKIMQEHLIDGHIVNINSVSGHQVASLPFLNVYPASKYAVTALTETLRKELVAIKSKIKISSVSPGNVNTDIYAANGFLDDEEVLKLLRIAPSLQSEDVANAVIYVLGTPPHVQVAELTIKPVGEFV
ncbi:farnesol dehydrogenase [Anoplophora glabripennis]|uniref:farnesol dehydrogenase n=1 Tax=Anoplophora glabripennis TaxID=217634 RepID=UPI00087352BC|nr:farnesol dehydrogenase [Anoplophora glabripennis]